ncbi:hypothetical protein GGI04_002674 [Coemansia thaxteri]|nr:hypothetical protein GGI04_002674 [Coemansia thaxteri]
MDKEGMSPQSATSNSNDDDDNSSSNNSTKACWGRHWHTHALSAARRLCTSTLCRTRSALSPETVSAEALAGESSRGTKRHCAGSNSSSSSDDVTEPTASSSTLAMLAGISCQQREAGEISAAIARQKSPQPAAAGADGDDAGVRKKRAHVSKCSLQAYALHNKPTVETLADVVVPLVFDSVTGLPPKDVVDELMGHTEHEFNIVSKILQPRALSTDYARGRLSTFLLLALMANNAMFSAHPAVAAAGGAVAASRQLIDRAKAFVPDALEAPTVGNCQALLLLSVAYMHQGALDVSSQYSSLALRTLHQLGVYKIDDNAWSDEGGWITESWLEREEIRRVIWGSFTVDTFLALMLHSPPHIVVDLSGVNRPCAQSVWYVGNSEGLEALAMPAGQWNASQPGDSEYLATLKQLKLGGVPWRINGTSIQLNFSVLGNAILRGISDPQTPQPALDALVANALRALRDWMASIPAMPLTPTLDEIHHTLMITSAAMCLKSVVTPYLITRSRQDSNKADGGNSETGNSLLGLDRSSTDHLLVDYLANASQVFRYTRLTADLMANKAVPPMFIAYSTMIIGGIFAACAHSAPTSSLHETQLARIRDLLVPRSVEAAVGKRFSTFIGPIRHIVRMPTTAADNAPALASSSSGGIPLTSNLCAIFGNPFYNAAAADTIDETATDIDDDDDNDDNDDGLGAVEPKDMPDYKLTFTAISSLLMALAAATKDESFFDFMLEHLEDEDKRDDKDVATTMQQLTPLPSFTYQLPMSLSSSPPPPSSWMISDAVDSLLGTRATSAGAGAGAVVSGKHIHLNRTVSANPAFDSAVSSSASSLSPSACPETNCKPSQKSNLVDLLN